MIKKLTCTIPSSPESYEIEINPGVLSNPSVLTEYLKSLATRFALITDHTVAELYGMKFCNNLGLEIDMFSFPPGEHHKTRSTKEKLEDEMFKQGLLRDTCVIVMGGGVATDIGGYIAATYCRGVPFVSIPTTLLGMVDASIGGKTGINVPQGKNMVGCLYQPQKVIIDPNVLTTLSDTELRNGFVEMIKHGLIGDAVFFEQLENEHNNLITLKKIPIQKAIFESCRIKNEIVQHDVSEKGKRRLLNFGHTIGHALETLSQFTLPHGEAVAIGMVIESHICHELGYLNKVSFTRIQQILKQYSLPLKLPFQIDVKELLNSLSFDKKSCNGQHRFTIIEEIGYPHKDYCIPINKKAIQNALEWFTHDLHCH